MTGADVIQNMEKGAALSKRGFPITEWKLTLPHGFTCSIRASVAQALERKKRIRAMPADAQGRQVYVIVSEDEGKVMTGLSAKPASTKGKPLP